MNSTSVQTAILLVALAILFVSVLLTFLQGRYLAKMLDQMRADHPAIYLQGARIEGSVKRHKSVQ